VLGVRVSTLDLERTARVIVRWAKALKPEDGPQYVCATSVHGLIEGFHDPAFRRILNGASVVTADGMPLAWMGRLRGHRGMRRVYGPALMERVCELSASQGVRHFMYGGAEGVPEELGRRLSDRFPGLAVVGSYAPPFRPLSELELQGVADRINETAADVVWVGLSTPKQERWIDSIGGKLRCKVVLSVGAAFDFHTGRVRQAPPWMQQRGLEWVYRLTQEPRRLWKRYAYNNPMFLGLAFLQMTGLKKFSDD
jgi:N-acetylglucosaminyldiphosphoundecaprenol N-acetyl-beta-D-mannosaminyltransferase